MVAEKLKKRAQFLAARRGRRLNGPFFFVEALERGDEGPPRFGLTVTRKVGNAVERNRIRRRLREAIRVTAEADMAPGIDYVIVARRDAMTAPFTILSQELRRRFARMAGPNRKAAAKGHDVPGGRSGSD
ncbi:ribonuclease P protein component [Jiella mangrovi]|uniref:Ribonuclease P protein component n=1 Tax=Jiella mangrovi TaxID=2821407 RepID=A0ABS4BKD7_9HYPH|nr:ribonuclease P protein component [Jiella mangrovi]MBP0616534.1 ribonuclease P protein component [Jiella mangrovi]